VEKHAALHVPQTVFRVEERGIQIPMARGRSTKKIGGSGPVGCR
jgi:hypothetical protein